MAGMSEPPQFDPEQPYTPEEAAAWLKLPQLGYDVDTLLRWVREGTIECIHIGHKVAFKHRQLVKFTEEGFREDSPRRRLRRAK